MEKEQAVIECDTTKGPFQMRFYRAWSPIGYDRAVELYEKVGRINWGPGVEDDLGPIWYLTPIVVSFQSFTQRLSLMDLICFEQSPTF